MRSLAAACMAIVTMGSSAVAAEAFSIRDAILQAVQSNPGVGEAAANRRATEAELRQVQSTLLPQVRLEGRCRDAHRVPQLVLGRQTHFDRGGRVILGLEPDTTAFL